MAFAIISGEETLDDIGFHVRWASSEGHVDVLFHVMEGGKRLWTIVVSQEGKLCITDPFTQQIRLPLNQYQGMQDLRRRTALLAWCFRTAYDKVFSIHNVDQLLFK